MATFVHFDMGADDPGRAQTFYSELFGWKFTPLPGPEPYYLVETSDLEGHPGIGGGMSKRTEKGQGILNYIGVASIDASLEKLQQLGGRIILPKQEVPGYGWLAVCADTEQNAFGLFEEINPGAAGAKS